LSSAIVFLTICLASAPSWAQGKGRVERVTFFSQALGINKSVNVYLPPGYGVQGEYYPVVYLFRGHEREWVNRDEEASRRGRNIQDIADELYAKGLIGKMILVMPGLSSDDNTVPGLGVNFVQVAAAGGKSGIGSGRFEDFMLDDVIPYIDVHYRTLPSRTQRGVDGFSLGGYTAMMFITKHPELFCSAGAYDGTMMWVDLDDPRAAGPLDDGTWLGSSLFDPAFGRPRDLAVMLSYNPCNLVRDATPGRLALLSTCQFLIHSAGSERAGNLQRSQHMVDVLRSRGLENAFADIRLAANAEHNWWFADEHMRLVLPLHWQKFQNPTCTMPLRLLAPEPGSRVAGPTTVVWSPGLLLARAFTFLSFSRDEGQHWFPLATLTSPDTTFVWNTAEVADGTCYRLRVLVVADSLAGVTSTQGRFTVDNPGNGPPDLALLHPQEGEVLIGTQLLTWFADDAEGDSLLFSADYSSDDGQDWKPLFGWQQGVRSFVWQTPLFENSPMYRLLLRCSDGTATVVDTSSRFVVDNPRTVLGQAVVRHVAGNGSGSVVVHVVSPSEVRDALYRVTFRENPTRYDVWEVGSGTQVVAGATEVDGATEGPLFDGMRLVVADFAQAEVNEDSTGWAVGASTLSYRIYLPTVDLGSELLVAVPWPADYAITLFSQVVDTSSGLWGAQPLPMMFTVQELVSGAAAEVVFNDQDADASISAGDELFLVARDEQGQPVLTWTITFSGLPGALPPVPGDVFVLKTKKPFTSRDVFEFSPLRSGVAAAGTAIGPGALVVNAYPNPFNEAVTITWTLPAASLRIFDLRGRLVRQMRLAAEASGQRAVLWDGADDGGWQLPSGVYLIRVQVGQGTRTSKVVLMR
jgi:S-formylglutathione hydrolase FrmB